MAGAFAALLTVSLFLPWYRASEPPGGCAPGEVGCTRETLSAFEAFAALDILLLVIVAGVAGLLVLEMSQRTPAVPVAWSAALVPPAIVAAGLVIWRTLDPPSNAVDEPVFALLGLVSAVGLVVAVLIGMRSESHGWRSTPRTGRGGRLGGRGPEPLPVPRVAGDGPAEEDR